jgi:chromate transporter
VIDRPAPSAGLSPRVGPAGCAEIALVFLKLGLMSFGGPIAHIGYFQRECVVRRRWLDEAAFADLVALCQFLPGPASSQVAFGLGMRRSGLAGGLAASIAFMLPSAIAMVLFAYGVSSLGDMSRTGWLHGLKLAASAVVALAVLTMAVRLCPDWPRRALGALSAALVLAAPGPSVPVTAILACALIGILGFQGPKPSGPGLNLRFDRSHIRGLGFLFVFALVLVALPVLSRSSGVKSLAVFDAFYRSGALVFGGGHVVLPLLRSAVVVPGWISDASFLAGYGAVQAMPGPLFTFGAYLGTVIASSPHAWIGGALALFALYLPGWLLIAGAAPFWSLLKARWWALGAIGGANAAVVGILAAALYRPVCTESIHDLRDAGAAVAGLILLGAFRTPPWAVVLAMAAAGQWLLR